MNSPFSVCVIILNYNGSEMTRRCVSSLSGQKYNALYLVDNSANPDENIQMQSITDNARKQQPDISVELVINSSNIGFSAGINRVIQSILIAGEEYDYYLLLNNDTQLPANTICQILDKITENPDYVLASPRINWNGNIVCYHGYSRMFGHVSEHPGKFFEPYLTGCCLLVDKALIKNDGCLLDEDFFIYGEDIELNWRARKMGKKLLCIESALIKHTGSGSSNKGDWFYEYHTASAHMLLGKKTGGNKREIYLFIVARIFYLLSRGIIRSIRYKKAVPLRATIQAIINSLSG